MLDNDFVLDVNNSPSCASCFFGLDNALSCVLTTNLALKEKNYVAFVYTKAY